MQLHDQLSVLTLQNPTVLDDAGSLRALLAPYVAGDPSATDEAELLVALVGQGVTRQLVGAIDGGADPAGAVADLGNRYAPSLGAPLPKTLWAVAALGYAAGRVSDAEVRRHLLDDAPTIPPSSAAPTMAPFGGATPPTPPTPPTAPPPAAPPTQLGQPSPPATPPAAPPAMPTPPVAPPAAPPAFQQPYAPAAPSYGASSYGASSSPTKSRTGLLIGGAVAAVVVIAVVVVVLLTRGGDDGPVVASDRTDPTASATSETPTSDVPTSDTPTVDEPTTAITDVEPTVSPAASQAYINALNAFSPKFTAAGDLMTEGRLNHEFDKTLQGARDMRDAVYEFDADVRTIDLVAIQESVNILLEQDREMIRLLDQIQNTDNSRKAVRKVGELPIDDFTGAFQDVAEEIDAHVG